MTMDPITLAMLAFAVMFALVFLEVPIGIAMALTGVAGFTVLAAPGPALSLVGIEFINALTSGSLATIPMFLLLGSFALTAGLAKDVYQLASALVGRRRGGLAIATVLGCAGFGAVCGSSLATVSTFGKISVPEMRSRGYDTALSMGIVASGGTLGSLIPPSIIMIIYSTLVEVPLVDLFAAAFFPALLAVALYCAVVLVYVQIFESTEPSTDRLSWRQKLIAITGAWRTFVLAFVVLGGIYSGKFTANEAAAIGLVLSFVFALASGNLTAGNFLGNLRDSLTNTVMIYIVIIGAMILGYFMTLTGAPREVVAGIEAANLGYAGTLILLLLLFVVMGCVFETVSAMVITMPFVIPLVQSLDGDLIWWGIVMISVIELGMITPPVGLNVFMLHSILPDVPLKTVFKGVMPFIVADIVRLALVTALPAISLLGVRLFT